MLLPKDLGDWLGESGPRRLLKSAYGLAEAPLAWYRVLAEVLVQCGFACLSSDACLLVLPGAVPPESPHGLYPRDYGRLPIVAIVGVHVDDLLCGGSGPQ